MSTSFIWLKEFHFDVYLSLKCLKQSYLRVKRFFYFGLISSLCVVLNKIDRLGILDMLLNFSKVSGVILQ